MKKQCFLVFFFLLIASAAFSHGAHGASLLFEPYVGVGLSKYRRGSITSATLGGKIGYGFDTLTLGIDAFYLKPLNFEISQVYGHGGRALPEEWSSFSRHNSLFFGVFFSSRLPFFFDIYGSLLLSYREKRKPILDPGLKLGLGLVEFFFIKINLEFIYSRQLCAGSCIRMDYLESLYGFLSVSMPLRHKFDGDDEEED